MKARKPLQRSGFKPKAMPERAPVVVCRLERAPNYASCDVARPAQPKGPAAKPGKHAPTVAEAAWMDAITALGCIACHIDGHPETPGAVHHILRGGLRMGHMHTICLCDPGHHQNGRAAGKVSRHPDKARFEAQYGPEQDLLELSQQMVQQRKARP